MSETEVTNRSDEIVLSEKAMEHLAFLMRHREGNLLQVVLHPKHCELCRELDEWARAIRADREVP